MSVASVDQPSVEVRRRARATRPGFEIRQLIGAELAGAKALARLAMPGLLTVLTVTVGLGLFALAGWFIAGSAVAGLTVGSTFSFLFPSAGVQALAVARTLSRYGDRIATHRATLELAGALRTAMFARALELPRDRMAELRTSELLGRITVDSDAVENLLVRGAFPVLAASAAGLGAIAGFSLLSASVGAVAAAGLTLAAVGLVAGARRQAGSPARRLVAARAAARRVLLDTIDGLPELTSFAAEELAAAEVTQHLDTYARARRRLTRLAARGQSVGLLLADLTLLAVIAAGAGLLGSRPLSPPWFVCVCVVTIAAFEPFGSLPAAVTALASARAAAARLNELLPDHVSPGAALDTAGGRCSVPCVVSMHNVDLRIAAGDAVIISGASGSGKSTILRAIAGVPSPGIAVLLDGVEPASIATSALAEHVTLVAQDAHVFDGTIRENLLLADPDARDDVLWSALRACALEGTVRGFPLGLDTPVGPGGAALSGGQRRRLSVAMGLLRRPAALLLDEPTEGLDQPTCVSLLAGVREHLPHAALVVALHDRQAFSIPWPVSARIDLSPATRQPDVSGTREYHENTADSIPRVRRLPPDWVVGPAASRPGSGHDHRTR